ncbi:MAG: tetratricopeptide repeat protein [Casimicrobiaceae bacterium]
MSSSLEAARLADEGYALLEAARYDEAFARLVHARELAPTDPLIHYRLALVFSETGRPGEALKALDAALALQPDNARAHNNRGSALQMLDRDAEAEGAFRRALDINPNLEPPYINLGHLLEQRGNVRDAAELYARAIARGLDAALFGHHIAAAHGRSTDRAPDSWVRATFDNFAPTFEAKLQELRYDAPRQLAAMLSTHTAGPLDILDLGCGTGLCGVALAERKRSLVGVDLSTRMLAQARLHGLYDELHAGEVHAWLGEMAPLRFDAAIAADVLIYIGALEELFRDVARVLRVGGWFAFSTEESETADFSLRASGRYAQSQAYIRRVAGLAFSVIAAESTIIRMESGKPINGRLYLLRRQ